MKMHDIVRLLVDLPEEGLVAGSIGVIIAVFDMPTPAFEVEFSDAKGRTIAQVALQPDEIQPVGAL